jgi:hypothetical protein
MCFSASASFGASIVLAGFGVATVKKVAKPSEIIFATIPLIFAVQQFTEGLVWVIFNTTDAVSLDTLPVYMFLFFAQILWPFWVPLSIYLLEHNVRRKKALLVFMIIGFGISLFHAYCMIFYPVKAVEMPYHIQYQPINPLKRTFLLESLYVSSIIIPPFISSVRRMNLLGILSLASFLISVVYFRDEIVSVWCFFAAAMSWFVFVVMRNLRRESVRLI